MLLVGMCGVCAVEALKDTLLAVVGDARPSVGDTKAELLPPEQGACRNVRHGQRQRDAAAGRRIGECVV